LERRLWVNCRDPAVIREGQLHPSKATNPPARSIVSSVPIADMANLRLGPGVLSGYHDLTQFFSSPALDRTLQPKDDPLGARGARMDAPAAVRSGIPPRAMDDLFGSNVGSGSRLMATPAFGASSSLPRVSARVPSPILCRPLSSCNRKLTTILFSEPRIGPNDSNAIDAARPLRHCRAPSGGPGSSCSPIWCSAKHWC
jgi:hypothetical protein